MEVAIVDTIPRDALNRGTTNLGFEIVKDMLKATPYHFTGKIEKDPEVVAFNVFYPMHIINILPFLKRNNLMDHKIIVGGQGVSNLPAGILGDIEIFKGEFDGWKVVNGWMRKEEITSGVFINGDKASIELTRGCRYKCKFCEYSWSTGGPYREKDIELVKEQINECVEKRINHVNFLSTNFAGYSKIDELFEASKNIHILNAETSPFDAHNFIPRLVPLRKNSLRMGVESFDEKTRIRIGKGISDAKLEKVLADTIASVNLLHIYLIYGLPGDNYQRWFDWVKILGDERKKYVRVENTLFGDKIVNTRNIRIEFSITNFEPCRGTPMEKDAHCDFVKKEEFLKEWVSCLVENGFISSDTPEAYTNWGRRHGKKETSYDLLMWIKEGHGNLEDLNKIFPSGISRSIRSKFNDRINVMINEQLN